MAEQLQTDHNDPLEYVKNIKKIGGEEIMAEYQVRYTEHYVNKTLKETIADLHLELFVTKDDILKLEKEISDLRKDTCKDIAELKYSLLLWIFTISSVGFSTTIGVTYFMLKFMLESALHIKI